MTGQELRQAIRCPAEAAGLEIEPGLTDVLLADLRAERDALKAPGGDLVGDYDAGRLPLLAHALRATWQQRHGSTLTVDGYRATGGIEHAIARTAEEAYNRLDAAGQGEASRIMFLRLVKVGASGGEDARRLVTRSDLTSGSATADAVLDEFIRCRLLTTARDATQITHEALLTAWPRLRTWLDEDRAGDLVRQGIEDAAAEWERAPRDTSLLHRGARLETAVAWASTRSGELTQTAQGFLDASRQLARRAILIRRFTTAILTALFLTASIFAVIASQQRATASRQRDQAISNLIVAEANLVSGTDPSLAAQLLLTAYRRQPTQDLAARLISSENELLGSPVTAGDAAVGSVAFSPDRPVLATGGWDGAIRLWNVSNPARPSELGKPLTAGPDLVYSVAFSPDGRVLACGDDHGTVRLWNVTDPARPREFGSPLVTGSSFVESVAFSPDGRVLASGGQNGGSGSYNGAVRLWDISDPAAPREISRSMSTGTSTVVWSVAFSPDGQTIATGDSSGTVRFWNITVPAHVSELGQPLHVGFSHAIAFSADGHTVASGGDGVITLWDTTDPAHPRQLGSIQTVGATGSVAFSPDGRTLASGGEDGTISLWDITNPAMPAQISQPLASGIDVHSVAFSPDGRTVASGSLDGTLRLLSRPQIAVAASTGGNPVGTVAFSPRGQTFASGGDDASRAGYSGAISLWGMTGSAAISEARVSLATGSSVMYSVVFSPDGKILASGGEDGAIRLWNVADPARPRELGPPLTATSGGSVFSVVFSPDGRILASGGEDGAIRLWNIADPARPRELGPPLTTSRFNAVFSLAFSPDGRTLASGNDDGAIRLWNVADPARPRELGRPLAAGIWSVNSVAFSPDGRTLASAGDSADYDGRVGLWDVSDPARPRELGLP